MRRHVASGELADSDEIADFAENCALVLSQGSSEHVEPQSYLWLHPGLHNVSQPGHAKQTCNSRLAWINVALAHHLPSTAAHDQHVPSVLMHGVGPQLVHEPTGSPFASTTVTVPPPVVQH